MVSNFVPTIRSNSGSAMASRVIAAISRAVECPRSSRPLGEKNTVCTRPMSLARAFMSSTNASTDPETWSARAIAASLDDCNMSP